MYSISARKCKKQKQGLKSLLLFFWWNRGELLSPAGSVRVRSDTRRVSFITHPFDSLHFIIKKQSNEPSLLCFLVEPRGVDSRANCALRSFAVADVHRKSALYRSYFNSLHLIRKNQKGAKSPFLVFWWNRRELNPCPKTH